MKPNVSNSGRSKRPSISDVAKQAGVSTATVSHVFSGKKRVNEDLAKKVRTAAKSLGYTIDRAASQMRTGRARVVSVLVPTLEDLFLNQFVSRLETFAQSAGYELIVSTSGNAGEVEDARLRALLAWRPAGVILVPGQDTLSDELLTAIDDTPLVAADRIHPSAASFDTVTIDNFGAGLKTAQHLTDKGAKSILIIAGDLRLHTSKERIRGAQSYIENLDDVSIEVLEIGTDPAKGAGYIRDYLNRNPRPDAVAGLTNVTTLAALSAFADLGVNVPEDLILLGYHDSLWMTARKTPITTLAQPVDEVARLTWERLTVRMNGDTGEPQNILLSATLVERASTLKAGNTQPKLKT